MLFEALIATVDKANAAILQGEEAQRDFFREFGFGARSFIRLDTEGQFNKMADALNRVEDPTLKAAVASALFGDEAVKLLPVLEQISRDGLAGVTAAAEENAQLLDGPAADALIRYADRWEDIRNRLESAARRVLLYVEPAFRDLGTWIVNTGIPALEEWAMRLGDAAEVYFNPRVALDPVLGPSSCRLNLSWTRGGCGG